MAKKRRSVRDILNSIAAEFGIDSAAFNAVAGIESSHNPKAKTGSYKGLFQFSEGEFAKYGSGNIFNAEDNARAAAKKWKADVRYFKKRVGRDPSATDIYMMHQQGRAGYVAHAANPDQPAWKNIRPYYSDAAAKRKGFSSGDAYAKAAVWGNIPRAQRAKFPGGVSDVTSGDFTGIWQARVQRGIGRQGGAAAPPTPERRQGDQRTFSSIAGGPEGMPMPERRPGQRNTAFPVREQPSEVRGMMQSDPRQGVHEANRHNPFPLEFPGQTAEQGSAPERFDYLSNTPLPASRREAGAKYQSRFEMSEEPTVAPVPGLAAPAPSPGMRVPGQGAQRGQMSKANLDRAFGQPFGELFANKADVGGGMRNIPSPPPAPPLFRNLFSSFFRGIG